MPSIRSYPSRHSRRHTGDRAEWKRTVVFGQVQLIDGTTTVLTWRDWRGDLKTLRRTNPPPCRGRFALWRNSALGVVDADGQLNTTEDLLNHGDYQMLPL